MMVLVKIGKNTGANIYEVHRDGRRNGLLYRMYYSKATAFCGYGWEYSPDIYSEGTQYFDTFKEAKEALSTIEESA